MKRVSVVVVIVFALAAAGLGQGAKSEVLRPPKGAKVAIIAFEDLECPQCGHVESLLEQAVNTYHVPIVRHDFPLPMHPWAFQGAVLARYFDSQSPVLGEQFRRAVYQNQVSIVPRNLHAFADNFARQHNVEMPFLIDPEGKLAAAVNKDKDLGTALGIDHTPTIYVVTDRPGATFAEVTDPANNLFPSIEQAKRETASEPAAARPTRRAAKKK